jgi:hypothetical protein
MINIKSFRIYINEADYMRFLKKNKNLSFTQRDEINDFFSKKSPHAGERFGQKYDWQSKKVRNMLYHEFKDFMMSTPAGRKNNIKQTKIPGSKGKDYWPMKLKNKDFIANIPLNWETAQFMNSCKYGTIAVKYCIGWTNDDNYWVDNVIIEKKVPIYITDGIKKWVVMILPGNKKYEVWDKFNDRDLTKSEGTEPIPGFSIKKELIGSRQSKLYDEIREEFYEGIMSFQWFIDEYGDYGNKVTIETADAEVIEWIVNNFNPEWFKNCDIFINDDTIDIQTGTISTDTYSIHDSGYIIVKITNCYLKKGIFELDHYTESGIFQSRIYDNCNITDSVLEECFIIGNSKFKKCFIMSGKVESGMFYDCDVNPIDIKGGHFDDCIIRPNNSNQIIDIDNNITAEVSEIYRMNINNGKYYDVSFIKCNINGGEFEECDFDKNTVINIENITEK